MRRVAPAAGFLILLIVVFYRFALLGETFSPADLLLSLSPWKDYYGASAPSNPVRSDEALIIEPMMLSHWARLSRGELPQIDPSQMSGAPAFYEGLLAGLLGYPLALVYYLAPAARADGLFAILRLLCAALFMYAWCRRLGLSRVASFGGGVVFMLNSHFIAWLTSPIPSVALWTPLALLAVERVLDRPTVRAIGCLALAAGPMFLGGYIPTALICSVLIGVYLVVGAMRSSAKPWTSIVYGGAGLALGVVVGGVGAGPTIANLWGSELAGRAMSEFPFHAYPLANIAASVFPDFWGTPLDQSWWFAPSNYCEMVTYVGVAPLVIAPIGIAVGRRDWRVWVLTALSICAIGLCYDAPVLSLLGELPVVKGINYFRWIVIPVTAASVLTAIGIHALTSAEMHVLQVTPVSPFVVRRLALAAGFAALAALAVATSWYWREMTASQQSRILMGGLRAAIAMAATVALLEASRRQRLAQPAAVGLVLLLFADLAAAGMGFNPTTTRDRFFPTTPGLDRLKAAGGERVAFIGDPPVGTVPGLVPGVYGLRTIAGYDVRADRLYQRLLSSAVNRGAPVGSSFAQGYVFLPRAVDPTSPVFDLLNVRFIATPSDLDVSLMGMPVAAVSDQSDTPVGEITAGREIGQTFLAKYDGLSRIDVLAATYARANRGTIVFHLREDGADRDWVRLDIKADAIVNNAWLSLAFAPIEGSSGKRFRFWIESPDGAPGSAATLWSSSRDAYPDGVRLENGKEQAGDLRFVAYARAPVSTNLTPVFRGDLNIVENMDRAPSAWMVHDVDLAADPTQTIDRIAAGAFDFRNRAAVQEPVSLTGASQEIAAESVSVTRSRPEALDIDVASSRPGLLVVSERFDPRWRAQVDETPVATVRTNAVLVGIPVDAGRHRVTLRYRDAALLWGIWTSVAGVAASLALVGWPVRRGRLLLGAFMCVSACVA